MYRSFDTLIQITLIAFITLFIIAIMYILNSMIGNIAIVAIGMVIILTIISLFLLKGTIGLILFIFIIIAMVVSIITRDISDGLFYGSIAMAFIVLVNMFKQYSGSD